MSFLQESTRYINYSKERHGGEITFITPASFPNILEEYQNHFSNKLTQPETAFLECLRFTEHYYMHLLKDDWTPQQARDVLPNATKTELIMTGFSSDWRFLMDLRLFEKTGKVHPDMKDLMQKAQKAMQDAGIWEDIMSKPSKFD
jgi:thymidylate synthase (FAD)